MDEESKNLTSFLSSPFSTQDKIQEAKQRTNNVNTDKELGEINSLLGDAFAKLEFLRESIPDEDDEDYIVIEEELWEEKLHEIDQKDQEIDSLDSELQSKRNAIQRKKSRISMLEDRIDKLSDEIDEKEDFDRPIPDVTKYE